MAALASDWLRHFQLLLLKPLNGIQRNLTGSKISTSFTKCVFFGRSEKQDGRPGLWLVETLSTFPLKPLNGIWWNLTGSKISASSTKFVFFVPIEKNNMAALASDWWRHFQLLLWNRWTEFDKHGRKQDLNVLYQVCVCWADRKNKMAAWHLIGWDIFNFLLWNCWTACNETDRKKDVNVLYQVCVFWADRKTKMVALASDWLRHFRLFLWNHWMEFDEAWQEARFQRLYQVCVFRADGKTRWHPWLLIGWDILNFSSETAEQPATKLDRKKDVNVLYQVCVFWADRKKQDGRPGQSVKKVAHCTRVHVCGPLSLLLSSMYTQPPPPFLLLCARKRWAQVALNKTGSTRSDIDQENNRQRLVIYQV